MGDGGERMSDDRVIKKLYTPKEINRMVTETFKFLREMHNLSHSEVLLVHNCLSQFLYFVNVDTEEFYKELGYD